MELLDRDQWGATAQLGHPMRLPAVGVHVHHSVTPVDDPVADMLELERIGVDRFGRFSYSFCGHPSGVVGEGAGLTAGAHTAGWNSTTFGFCLIGNYDVDPVTDAQVQAFVEWRQWMVANGWLRPDHWIEPHQARAQTACPGANTLARWGELTAPAPPVFEEDDMALFNSGEDFVQHVAYGVERALAGLAGRMTGEDLVQHTAYGVERALAGEQAKALLRQYGIDAVTSDEARAVFGDDVDEAALAAFILATLTPEAIAAAIPEMLAQDVADVLAERLAD